MDRGMMTGVVFLDLKKAFDTVDHQILIKKLATFNIGPLARQWFESYLTDSYQAVKCLGTNLFTIDMWNAGRDPCYSFYI